MAALYCWKTGLLGICKNAELPDGTLVLQTGTLAEVRIALLATAAPDAQNNRYVPGMRELPEDTGEDIRFAIVQAYIKMLARRIAYRTREGRLRWQRMEAQEAKQR